MSPWTRNNSTTTREGGIKKRLQKNSSRSTPCLTPDPVLRSKKAEGRHCTESVNCSITSSPYGSSLDSLDRTSTSHPKSSTSLPQDAFGDNSFLTKSYEAIQTKNNLSLPIELISKSCDSLSPDKEEKHSITQNSIDNEISVKDEDFTIREFTKPSCRRSSSKTEDELDKPNTPLCRPKSCEVISPTRKLKQLSLAYEALAQSCEVLSPDKEILSTQVKNIDLIKSCEVLSPEKEHTTYVNVKTKPISFHNFSTSNLDCSVNYSNTPLKLNQESCPPSINKGQGGVFVAARDTLMNRLCGGESKSPPLPASEHPTRVPKYIFTKGAPPCQRRVAGRLSDSAVISRGTWLGRHGRSRSEYFLGRTGSMSSSGSSGIWSHSSSGSSEWGNWSKDILDSINKQRNLIPHQKSSINIGLNRSREDSDCSDDFQVRKISIVINKLFKKSVIFFII